MSTGNVVGRRAALGFGGVRPACAQAGTGAPPAGFVVRCTAGGIAAEAVEAAEADGAAPPRTPSGIVVLQPHVFSRQVRHDGSPRLCHGSRNA